MPTAKQITANQKNAQKSTGPKTVEGKLAASQNATRHGLLSKKLILPGLENEREWKEHLQGIMDSLNPVGTLESTLAARIAALLWRANRVIRYEAETLRKNQEEALQMVTQCRKGRDIMEELPAWTYNPEKAEEMRFSAQEDRRLLTKLLDSKDDESFSNDEAIWLIEAGFEYIKKEFKIPPEKWPPKQEGFKGWNRILIYRVLAWMAQTDGQEFNAYLNSMGKKMDSYLEEKKKYAEEANRELESYRIEHLLPSQTSNIEGISRYETHLQRTYLRDLEELRRIQAFRKENHTPSSGVIDVEFSPIEPK